MEIPVHPERLHRRQERLQGRMPGAQRRTNLCPPRPIPQRLAQQDIRLQPRLQPGQQVRRPQQRLAGHQHGTAARRRIEALRRHMQPA